MMINARLRTILEINDCIFENSWALEDGGGIFVKQKQKNFNSQIIEIYMRRNIAYNMISFTGLGGFMNSKYIY